MFVKNAYFNAFTGMEISTKYLVVFNYDQVLKNLFLHIWRILQKSKIKSFILIQMNPMNVIPKVITKRKGSVALRHRCDTDRATRSINKQDKQSQQTPTVPNIKRHKRIQPRSLLKCTGHSTLLSL